MLVHTALDLAHSAPAPPSVAALVRTLQWHTLVIQPLKHAASWLAAHLARFRPRSLWDLLPGFGHYRRYYSRAAEQRWWAAAARGRAALAPSDAHMHAGVLPGLVTPYAPRLLPTYREPRASDDAARERALAPGVYRKWHRLVYPNEKPPSRREAARLIKYLSTRDRREIARIAHLVPDETVAQTGFRPSPVYRSIWESWLLYKGPDLTIVFE
ncbi:hypothetical protein BC834DRAFT_967989 [Gloeopeniophorella convolvens]|nr:hypothetical protein BC834DRAFT_967989 [Gloeopeniophorella convolvens]